MTSLFLSADTNNVADIIVAVILTLMTVAAVLAAVVFLCKYANADKTAGKKYVLIIIFAAGFVLRLVFSMCIRGYRSDYRIFTDMFSDLAQNGIGGYYDGDPSGSLYPVPYLIYLVFGGLSNITGLSDFALGQQFMVKFPLILADLAAAYGVYRITEAYFGKKAGYVLCALVCGCPAFFMASSIWTSQIAITAALAVWTCYAIARMEYAEAVALGTATAFSSRCGIYLFPVLAVFAVFHAVRAASRIVKAKKGNGAPADVVADGENAEQKKRLQYGDYAAAVEVPVSFVLSLVTVYLIGLLMFYSYSVNFFRFIYEFTLKPFAEWDYFTHNGLSIYMLFGQNGETPGARFPAWLFFGLFTAIIVAVVCVIYFTKRNRATLVMLAAYSLITMEIYYPGASPVGAGCGLLVLVAAYALVRDKRLIIVLLGLSAFYVLSASGVLASEGYMNNLASYYFSGTADDASGGIAVLATVCSALAVAVHLFFTYITVSIGMSGQKKLLGNASDVAGSIKELFAVKGHD